MGLGTLRLFSLTAQRYAFFLTSSPASNYICYSRCPEFIGGIVKEYSYGYCRVAYCIYDKRYDLRRNPGIDFYSLAYEYYLALCKNDFRQLADFRHTRTTGTTLRRTAADTYTFVLSNDVAQRQTRHRRACDEHGGRHGDVAYHGHGACDDAGGVCQGSR